MKINNLWVDDKGESHWRDVEVEYVEKTRAGRLSKRLPATGVIFREVQPDYDLDWHPGSDFAWLNDTRKQAGARHDAVPGRVIDRATRVTDLSDLRQFQQYRPHSQLRADAEFIRVYTVDDEVFAERTRLQ